MTSNLVYSHDRAEKDVGRTCFLSLRESTAHVQPCTWQTDEKQKTPASLRGRAGLAATKAKQENKCTGRKNKSDVEHSTTAERQTMKHDTKHAAAREDAKRNPSPNSAMSDEVPETQVFHLVH